MDLGPGAGVLMRRHTETDIEETDVKTHRGECTVTSEVEILE